MLLEFLKDSFFCFFRVQELLWFDLFLKKRKCFLFFLREWGFCHGVGVFFD